MDIKSSHVITPLLFNWATDLVWDPTHRLKESRHTNFDQLSIHSDEHEDYVEVVAQLYKDLLWLTIPCSDWITQRICDRLDSSLHLAYPLSIVYFDTFKELRNLAIDRSQLVHVSQVTGRVHFRLVSRVLLQYLGAKLWHQQKDLAVFLVVIILLTRPVYLAL